MRKKAVGEVNWKFHKGILKHELKPTDHQSKFTVLANQIRQDVNAPARIKEFCKALIDYNVKVVLEHRDATLAEELIRKFFILLEKGGIPENVESNKIVDWLKNQN